MTFAFPVDLRREKRIEKFKTDLVKAASTEQITPIQGIMPGSIQEWRVAVALMQLRIPFQYQVPLWGGSRVRGGQRVDFVIYTPFPIPLQVFGEYWHRSQVGSDDSINLARLTTYFQHKPIVLLASELESVKDAVAAIRRELQQ